MSDLEQARDHARTMAARTVDPRDRSRTLTPVCNPAYLYAPRHDECRSEECRCACHPRHVPTAAERALWAQIADEIDAYLAPVEVGPDLFGGDE